ncbi:hypothetical protein LWI29_021842 [Acer saccharum]|uniref:Uncharacterized protein n=1 Tax=Acer saccharum TaxID=4024 RepID=A0AA39T8S0_ACESA|nr:hypothetical protein LWI29_021842 [Acer saccharum]
MPFKLGLRFPIPLLARQLLNFFEIALSQLMPNGWRILLSLEVLIERQKLDFSFENFLYTYHLKEHDTDCGRYMIVAQHHRGHLISELTTRDPDWKPKFFFTQEVLVDRESKVDPGSGRRDDDAEDPFYQSKREELEGLTDQEAKREEGWKCPCSPNCQPTKIVASVEPSEPVAKKSKKRPHTEEIQDKGLVIRVNSLTSSNAKIKKELEKARYTEIVAKEAMKGAVEKLAGLEEENTRLKASLKSSEDKLS